MSANEGSYELPRCSNDCQPNQSVRTDRIRIDINYELTTDDSLPLCVYCGTDDCDKTCRIMNVLDRTAVWVAATQDPRSTLPPLTTLQRRIAFEAKDKILRDIVCHFYSHKTQIPLFVLCKVGGFNLSHINMTVPVGEEKVTADLCESQVVLDHLANNEFWVTQNQLLSMFEVTRTSRILVEKGTWDHPNAKIVLQNWKLVTVDFTCRNASNNPVQDCLQPDQVLPHVELVFPVRHVAYFNVFAGPAKHASGVLYGEVDGAPSVLEAVEVIASRWRAQFKQPPKSNTTL